MDQERSKEHESQRVAALEREVAKLRQELAEREGERGEGPRREELPPTGFSASRSKMVLVGIAIALLVLATMGVLFSALSSGFSSFADKAARIFVPEGSEGESAPPREGSREERFREQEKPEEALPRVPGL